MFSSYSIIWGGGSKLLIIVKQNGLNKVERRKLKNEQSYKMKNKIKREKKKKKKGLEG